MKSGSAQLSNHDDLPTQQQLRWATPPATLPKPTAAVVIVDALTLEEQLRQNSGAVRRKYLGARLQFTAETREIGRNHIRVAAGDGMWADCYYDDTGAAEADRLSDGTYVTVTGTLADVNGSHLKLQSCRFQAAR